MIEADARVKKSERIPSMYEKLLGKQVAIKTILGKRTEGIVKKQSGDTLYVEVINGEKKGQEIKYSLSACIRGKLIVVLE